MDAELEAKLIEQEHRIVRVIQNFVNRNQWANEDPRRAAAKNALVWRALAPVSITAAAGSTVALATLLVLFWQTRLMSEQNASFKEQNAKLQSQIDLQTEQDAARRRTEVIANLYETVGDPLSPSPQPRANARTRRESVFEFVRLERQRLSRLAVKGVPFDGLNLAQARLDGTNLSGVDLNGAILAGTWLHNTNVSDSNVSGADLRVAYLEHTSFARSDLRNVNCEGCNLIQVYFSSADLRGANFVSAGVRNSEFLGADLRGSDFTGVREYEGANFRFANIARVRADAQFIAFAKRQGAVLIEDDQAWSQYRAKLQRSSN